MSDRVDDRTAQALAEFVHGLALPAVPAAMQQRALHLALDAVGCGLAARHEDFAVRLAAAIGDLGDGENAQRGVPGFARRLPLRDAVWLSGVVMHGLDYDDTHMAGVVHLTVGILPAVLGLAAERDASGAEALLAYIAGLEAGARVASIAKGGFHAQGFHPTGVSNCFAAALACGKLLGLKPAQLVAAQGIALSLASGNLQFLEDGAWTKRLHPGWAAQAGLQAARLAAHDIPAPTAPYEGRFGLFKAYLGPELQKKTELALGSAGLGSVWELEQVAIKPFPMCHFVHAAADAAIALHAQGVAASDIERVEALMPAGTMPVVCEPAAAKRRPGSDYDAKFSLHYAVASGLLRGRLGLKELLPAAYTEPAALALMDRVHCSVDAEASFPLHYSGELRVTLKDGRVLRHREAVNRGDAERPLSNEDIQAKFLANTTLHFDAAHARAVQAAVLALPHTSVRELETLLARDPG